MKINFIYHTLGCLGSGYMGTLGLKNALHSNGLLNYSCDTMKEKVDESKLEEAPIFMMRGYLPDRAVIASRTKQFKACWNTESWFSRHGGKDKDVEQILGSKHLFDMMFTCAETDVNMYDMPTYWIPSWADTTVFQEYDDPEYEGLGFIGDCRGREDFIDPIADIVNIKRSDNNKDHVKKAISYAELICKFKMLVSPPGRSFTSMCGRAFEIMACNRLCFQYLNEETMYRHVKYFTDGEDIVFFKTTDELREKYKYYLKHPKEAADIAFRGFTKVLRYHNQDARAKYITICMEKEINGKSG